MSVIKEGTINFAPEDKKAIYRYLKDINEYCDKIFASQKEIEVEDLAILLSRKSNELKSNIFPFKIDYASKGKGEGWYINDPSTIVINVSALTDWREKWIDYREPNYFCYSIEKHRLAVTFIHEFTHYIQDTLRKEKSGHYKIPKDWNAPGKYLKNPWEQQAFGIGHLELLRQKFNIKKPNAIMNQLKKVGLSDEKELQKLKDNDFQSWKRIMKNAVMAAIADEK